MAGEYEFDYAHLLVLTVAGLISGLLTCAISYANSSGVFHFQWYSGVLFAVAISGCLATFGLLSDAYKFARLLALTSLAYPFSFLASFVFEATIGALLSILMQHAGHPSILAIFVGGLAGGFLILVEVLYQLGPGIRKSDLVRGALTWSLLGGLTGVLGWELGSTLGNGLWSIGRTTNLIASSENYPRTIEDSSHMLSLFVVWQTGMGFVMGLVLRRYKATAPDALPSP